MDILELVNEFGLEPRLVSSTNGGEYKSPCPSCGGKDRFIIWPKIDRYWCRRCDTRGDAIQFCRDFFTLEYKDACEKVGKAPSDTYKRMFYGKNAFIPKESALPAEVWQKRAGSFVLHAHITGSKDSDAIKHLLSRGFSLDTLNTFLLGWNESTQFEPLPLWGLSQDGIKKKVWLPRGIVIPTFFNGTLLKIKIRRADWKPDDTYPKYVEVVGSQKTLSFYGNAQQRPFVLVESELDAILVQQFANDLCCCVALGGCNKKPDIYADRLLKPAKLILFALDFDEAGKKEYQFWKSTYDSQVRPWPIPREKSPGDAYHRGVNLRKWIEAGIRLYSAPDNRL